MYKQYLSQTLHLLKENKLLSFISIIGTALAICMIMVIVLIYEIRTANYEPEVNRDRMLTVRWAVTIDRKHPDWNSSSMLSLRVIKECLYPIKTAEAVTGILPNEMELVTAPGLSSELECQVSYTDDAFWKVFEFNFVRGSAFTGADFQSSIKKIVVSASIARQLFGTIDIVGKTIDLNFVDYTVCGVVKDVSVLADASYADIWAPYTTTPKHTSTFGSSGLLGDFRCHILARSASDFDVIRKEVNKNVQILNSGQNNEILTFRGQPDTQFAQLTRPFSNEDAKIKETIINYSVMFLIILLVPAINLSGMTLSRMRKRMSEIGVRKALGATRKELLMQILFENFFLTCIGGLLGLGLSYLSILMMKEWLLEAMNIDISNAMSVLHLDMLFHPLVFVCAFIFCLLLNLLSAGIPAWRVSKTTIVNALNDK